MIDWLIIDDDDDWLIDWWLIDDDDDNNNNDDDDDDDDDDDNNNNDDDDDDNDNDNDAAIHDVIGYNGHDRNNDGNAHQLTEISFQVRFHCNEFVTCFSGDQGSIQLSTLLASAHPCGPFLVNIVTPKRRQTEPTRFANCVWKIYVSIYWQGWF